MRSPLTLFFIILVNVCINQSLVAQTDTNQVAVDSTIHSEPVKNIDNDFLLGSNSDNINHSPKKAALYSMVLPGLGQAYNKKYWKVGVVYALEGFCVYQIVTSHILYKQYRDELFLRDIVSNTDGAVQWTSTDEEFDGLTDAAVRTRKDLYRDTRDQYFLYASLVYAINIVDAVVDAHLINFNPRKNRRLKVSAALIPSQTSANIGLNLKFRF